MFGIVIIFLIIGNRRRQKIELVWVIDGITKVNEETENRINQILEENGMDYSISFRCDDFFENDEKDPVTQIEQLKDEQVDILCIPVNKAEYSGYSVGLDMVNKKLLYCLDELLDDKMIDWLKTNDSSLATSINGKYYGISSVGLCATKTFWNVDNKMFDKYNVKTRDFINKELWQMESLFTSKFNLPKECIGVGESDNMMLMLKYEFITDYIGIRMDDDKTVVRNILSDEYAVRYLDSLHRLAMKGLLTKDNSADVLLYLSNDENTNFELNKGKQKIEIWKPYYSYNSTNMQQGVASWSNHKKEAVKVLEFLFTNEV